MTIKKLSPELLGSLVEKAAESPRARQHHNIHERYDDPCQRFLNAIGMDSYIQPHRHALDPKSECLVAMRGKFALVIFGDDGAIQEVIRFGTEKYGEDGGLSVGVDLPPGAWHTIVPLVPGAVLLELKAGPFNPTAAKEPAPWAPEEGAAEGHAFLMQLRGLIG